MSNNLSTHLVITLLLSAGASGAARKQTPSAPIDLPPIAVNSEPRISTPGSLFAPGDRYGDLVRDLRAGQVGDIVTVLVSDQASAVSSGKTTTSRKSAANSSITSLAGPLRPTGVLPNLLNASGNQSLDGQGSTTRDTSLSTTISLPVSTLAS